MKKLIYILSFLAGSSSLIGQDIGLSYEINFQEAEKYSMEIYMQSMSEVDQPIAAINFSLALPEGCVEVDGHQSIFEDVWTSYLEHVKLIPSFNETYGSWHYSSRWQYGNADPGLPNTIEVVAPAREKKALKIMEISLSGSCVDQLYFEALHENPLNQIGDGNLKSIPWSVIRPQTEMELQQNLWLEVFPNPVSDKLNIRFEGVRDEALFIELSSIDGRKLMLKKLDEYADNSLQLDMSNLPSAMYWLTVSAPHMELKNAEKIKILKK